MKKTRRRGGIFARISALILFFTFIIASASFGFAYLNSAAESMPEQQIIDIAKGSSGSLIAQRLSSSGLIRSASFFKLVLRISGRVTSMKSGSYLIKKGSSSLAIMTMIEKGQQLTKRVTIPEGLTRRAIAHIFEEQGVCKADDFLSASANPDLLSELGVRAKNAEGYLFPDTYNLSLNSNADTVVSTMVKNFFSVMEGEVPQFSELSGDDFFRNLIVASIVEREYRLESEAPLMASVFHNRLRIGMALQSCATVVYVMTELQGKPHPNVLYARDIAIEDPYNTYAQNGLPPGPISNPGRASLLAAFNPPPSNYLYFRLIDTEKGAHKFSVNLDQHNQAGNLSIKAASGRQ